MQFLLHVWVRIFVLCGETRTTFLKRLLPGHLVTFLQVSCLSIYNNLCNSFYLSDSDSGCRVRESGGSWWMCIIFGTLGSEERYLLMLPLEIFDKNGERGWCNEKKKKIQSFNQKAFTEIYTNLHTFPSAQTISESLLTWRFKCKTKWKFS